jgi:hypothetical protein
MEDRNSDKSENFCNLMRRKYAVQMRPKSISDVGKRPVKGQINSIEAVPFYVVTALRRPPIPNVITLVAMDDIIIAGKNDMASDVSSPFLVSRKRLVSALQESNKSFWDVDTDGQVTDMSPTTMYFTHA